jgi:hypothetical protein
MAFLFKSKKNLEKAQTKDSPNGVVGSQTSIQGGNGRPPTRDEKSGGGLNHTPGSSVNNSMNSLGGGTTPSPEQNGRRGPSSEQQVSDLPVSLKARQSMDAPSYMLYGYH